MKRSLLKFISIALTVAGIMLSFSSCFVKDATAENADVEIPPLSYKFENPPLAKYYRDIGYSSLAKLKVLEIDEREYTNSNDNGSRIAKCEVIEDYFGVRESGEILEISFYTSNRSFNENTLNQLMSSGYVLALFGGESVNIPCKNNIQTDEIKIAPCCNLSYCQLIPIVAGKLNVSSAANANAAYADIDQLLDALDDYFRDGMSEEEFRASAYKLEADTYELSWDALNDYGLLKCRTELLYVDSKSGDISLSVDKIDLYLDYITITVENHTDDKQILTMMIQSEELNEAGVPRFIMGVKFSDDKNESVDSLKLEPKEKKTVQLIIYDSIISNNTGGEGNYIFGKTVSPSDPDIWPEFAIKIEKWLD